MYELTVSAEFDAAHRLYNYEGKCARLHGHTWKVEVEVRSPQLDERGMVCDFFDLRREVSAVLEPFDHTVINEVEPFTELSPTSENLAFHLWERLSAALRPRLPRGSSVSAVTVWESSRSRACYRPEGMTE